VSGPGRGVGEGRGWLRGRSPRARWGGLAACCPWRFRPPRGPRRHLRWRGGLGGDEQAEGDKLPPAALPAPCGGRGPGSARGRVLLLYHGRRRLSILLCPRPSVRGGRACWGRGGRLVLVREGRVRGCAPGAPPEGLGHRHRHAWPFGGGSGMARGRGRLFLPGSCRGIMSRVKSHLWSGTFRWQWDANEEAGLFMATRAPGHPGRGPAWPRGHLLPRWAPQHPAPDGDRRGFPQLFVGTPPVASVLPP